jgi:TetR/AcrR family transcriptional regulator, cholesterol catabolism regulator
MSVPADTLTANQAARRGRVLDAAMELAAEGGYDAVQMRDVAARAQVALGTIYRYFSSKDHLLAACQVELWRAMAEHFDAHPSTAADPADRVVHVLERAMRGAEREPKRTAALVTASASPDPAVRDCQADIMATMDRVLEGAMGDVEASRRAQIALTLRQVWFAWLLGWVNGWNDAATVNRELAATARLLLTPA